jgi:hypothetical protein
MMSKMGLFNQKRWGLFNQQAFWSLWGLWDFIIEILEDGRSYEDRMGYRCWIMTNNEHGIPLISIWRV